MVGSTESRPPKSHIIHDHNLINPAAPVAQAKIFIQQLQRPELIGSFNNQTTTVITTVLKRNDCQLGNDIVMSNGATLGGHVRVDDFAIIGGLSAVHQFGHVGTHAFVGGMTGVAQDLPPWMLAAGSRALVHGPNLVGLRRAGASRETISAFKQAFRLIWRSEMPRSEALDLLANDYANLPQLMEFVDFVRSSERGLCPAEKNVEKKLDDDAV